MDDFDKELIDSISKTGFDPKTIYMLTKDSPIKRTEKGFCPICEQETVFVSPENWLRDYYICIRCHSLSRQRALAKVLSEVRAEWRSLKIHESSPSGSLFQKFKLECTGYSYAYYDEKGVLGECCTFGGDNCTN